MSIRSLIFGRRLASSEDETQRLDVATGVPALGLDALGSAAYGPEAALTILLPAGAAGLGYIQPITWALITLLVLLFLSYRQTIATHPRGAGAYLVASENIGPRAGLIAACALIVDYVLVVAVGISAGVGALVSAAPVLLPFTLPLCLTVLTLLTVVNLRGVRSAGLAVAVPTFAFVAFLGVAIGAGVVEVVLSGGAPRPVSPTRQLAGASAPPGALLVLHAFASGCTALTGVEAVSNAVPVFRAPSVRRAQRTLAAICGILLLLLAGIALLCRAYGIGATPPGQAGYESVLSQLVAATLGRGAFYYVAIGSILAVLCLSANTGFVGFPRVARLLALDEYLPPRFAHRGRRLVYSHGVVVLALFSAALLVAFGGVTDRLIPLFAIGALLTFTLSQAGMVAYWRRHPGPHATRSLAINALGAAGTGAALVVVAVGKFRGGAWLTVVVIPSLYWLFTRVRRHHERLDRATLAEGPLELGVPEPTIVVVFMRRLDRVARKGLRLASSMASEVQAVQVLTGDPDEEDLTASWSRLVEEPARAAGRTPPLHVVIRSTYREHLEPLVDYVASLAGARPDAHVAVIVPELVQHRWYHALAGGQRASVLRTLLLMRGCPNVLVIHAPWYLELAGPAARRKCSPEQGSSSGL